MKKIVCAISLAIFAFTSIFSLSGTSAGITESDIIAFIDNYQEVTQITTEALEKSEVNALETPDIMSAIPEDEKETVSAKLNEFGISGSNALEKTLKISFAVLYDVMKPMMDLLAGYEDYYDDDMTQIYSFLETFLSQDDIDAIGDHKEELSALLEVSDIIYGSYGSDYDDYDYDDYDWDDDYDYDYDDYGWDDDYDYDYDDYDWDDYDWDDDYDYDYDYDYDDYGWYDDYDDYSWHEFSEEEELESENAVNFLNELMPSLSSSSGSSEFLYKTYKAGNYKEITITEENDYLFSAEWSGSKYPSLTVAGYGIRITYSDADAPFADEFGDVNILYVFTDATSNLYKATINGNTYYERVIHTKEYGIIHIWIDTSDTNEYDYPHAVLSVGDYLVDGYAIIAMG